MVGNPGIVDDRNNYVVVSSWTSVGYVLVPIFLSKCAVIRMTTLSQAKEGVRNVVHISRVGQLRLLVHNFGLIPLNVFQSQHI